MEHRGGEDPVERPEAHLHVRVLQHRHGAADHGDPEDLAGVEPQGERYPGVEHEVPERIDGVKANAVQGVHSPRRVMLRVEPPQPRSLVGEPVQPVLGEVGEQEGEEALGDERSAARPRTRPQDADQREGDERREELTEKPRGHLREAHEAEIEGVLLHRAWGREPRALERVSVLEERCDQERNHEGRGGRESRCQAEVHQPRRRTDRRKDDQRIGHAREEPLHSFAIQTEAAAGGRKKSNSGAQWLADPRSRAGSAHDPIDSAELPPGEYDVRVLTGWKLYRQAPGTGGDLVLKTAATLTSVNPAPVTVRAGNVRFDFDVNGDDDAFGNGALDVQVGFNDVPGPRESLLGGGAAAEKWCTPQLGTRKRFAGASVESMHD